MVLEMSMLSLFHKTLHRLVPKSLSSLFINEFPQIQTVPKIDKTQVKGINKGSYTMYLAT